VSNTERPIGQTDIEANLRTNLGALAERHPQLADMLADVQVPERYQLQCGDDGTLNYRDTLAEDCSGWFGHTAMPTVRDRMLADQFQFGADNLLLWSIGHGLALKLLLERVRSYQTVFVIEEDQLNVALALRLHDLAKYIVAGQLVIICEPAGLKGLKRFLDENDGYLTPTQMISWPWLAEQQLAAASDRLGQIRTAINQIHQLQLEKLSRLISKRSDLDQIQPLAAHPPQVDQLAVLVMCHSTAGKMLELSANLTDALAALGCRVASVLPDRPEHSSLIPYARQIAKQQPHVLILVGQCSGGLAIKLPDNLPTISIVETATNQLPGEGDLKDRELLVLLNQEEAKTPPADERRTLLQPAVNDRLVAECIRLAGTVDSNKLLLLGDYSDADAAEKYIKQKSYQALWRAVRKELEANPQGYWRDGDEGYLRRAEQRCGVELREKELQDAFAAMVARQLAGAVFVDACAGRLTEAGLQFDIWGSGWQVNDQFAHLARPVPAQPVDQLLKMQAYAGLIVADVAGVYLQLILHAIAAGTPVLILSPAADALKGRVPLSLDEPPATDLHDLAGRARQILDGDEQLLKACKHAADRLLAEHTYAHRSAELIEKVGQLV